MKLVAPDYYTRFTCIADRCRHNCCAQGWEIDIDDDTYALYRGVPGEFGARLMAGIAHGEVPTFKLDEQERCPFWNESGLCDIISTLGEDGLCDICADHPRFRNFFSDRVEVGLGLCCEEACRIILTNTEKVALIELECDGDDLPDAEDAAFYAKRDAIFEILQDRSRSFDERAAALALEYNIKPNSVPPAEWAEIYRELERLDAEWARYLDALAECEGFASDGDDLVLEQLAVYLVFRHTADALDDAELAQRLAFCLHAVQIIRTIAAASGADIAEICRLYSGEIEYSDENVYKLMKTLG